MSVRLQITHKEKIGSTVVTYRADIEDTSFGGTATEKRAGGVFFDWEYDKLNDRAPFENPVQKSSFTINLFIQDSSDLTLVNDILDADEDRFKIHFYIDGTHKWSGSVLNDLVEYPEGPFPFTAEITAKDLSNLEGVDYDLVEFPTETRISEIIAECLLETGLTLPIRSYTNLTNSEITDQTQDFLFALFHQKFALRNKDAAIPCLDVLGHICRAYNLIIRQSDARWIIEQLPAVAKGDDVQFDYDSNGLNPVSSTPSRTVTIDRTDSFLLPTSVNKVTGALKEIRSHYKHRTLILNIPAEDTTHNSASDDSLFPLDFDNVGEYRFSMSIDVEVHTVSGFADTGTAFFQVRAERPGSSPLYLNQATGAFTATERDVEISLSGTSSPLSSSYSLEMSGIISSSVSTIVIEPMWAEVTEGGDPQDVDKVIWTNIDGILFNTTVRDWNASIEHRYNRSGNYSAKEEIEETLLGDGPIGGANFASKGRPATGDSSASEIVDTGNFKIRGVSEALTLEEITLRERVSMRRSALRNIRASLWMKYSPEDLISYDSETWFFLGGRFQAKQSRWDANILLLDYDGTTTGDIFQTIVEEGGDPSGGSTDGGGGSSGSGITLSQADSRYLQIVGLGSVTQAWNAQLDTLSGLSSDQATALLGLSGTVRFNNLEVTGTINYVNETNLQVEDKTITINKGGTDASSESAGLIVERVSANQSVLWNSTDGWDFSDSITAPGASFTGFVGVQTGGDQNGLAQFGDDSASTDQYIYIASGGVANKGIKYLRAGAVDWRVGATDGEDFEITGLRSTDDDLILRPMGDVVLPDTALVINQTSDAKTSVFNSASGQTQIRMQNSATDTWYMVANDTINAWYVFDVVGSNRILSAHQGGGVSIGTDTLSGSETLRVNGASLMEGDITQSSGTIGTDNFTSQTTGWRGTYAGDWDMRSLYTDELRAKAFTADITQALAGSDFLTKSVAILDADFTIPWGQPIVAVDTTNEVVEVSGDHTSNVSVSDTLFIRKSTGNNGTYTVASVTFNGTSGNTEITVNEDVTNSTADGYIGKTTRISVEDLPGQNDTAAFETGDWVRLRVFDRSGGGLVIADAWGRVSGYSDQTDNTQDWTFMGLDTGTVTGSTVYKGSVVLDYGQAGDGYIERTVLDAQGSPYSQIVTWTDNPIDGANKTIKTRTGNLNGSYGYTTDEFGAAFGDPSAENITVDPTNGLRIRSGSDVAAQLSGTVFTLGSSGGNHVSFDTSDGSANIDMSSFNLATTTLVLESTTPKLALGASASSLGLTSVSDTGTYFNGSGHARVGTTDASGNLTKGFTFDGTDLLIEAGNASIGASSGSFGPAGVLTYDGSSVGISAFTASSSLLSASNGGLDIEMGNGVFGSAVFGFAVSDGTTNNFAYLGESGGNYQLRIRVAGVDVIQVGSDVNRIAEFEIAGTLTMGASGEITNSGGDYSIGDEGITLDAASVTNSGNSISWRTGADPSNDGLRIFVQESLGNFHMTFGPTTGVLASDTFNFEGSVDVSKTLSAGSGTESHVIDGFLEVTSDLKVGVWNVTEIPSAPGTPAEGARLYIDPSDGDFKIKFDNGIVRTIALN